MVTVWSERRLVHEGGVAAELFERLTRLQSVHSEARTQTTLSEELIHPVGGRVERETFA